MPLRYHDPQSGRTKALPYGYKSCRFATLPYGCKSCRFAALSYDDVSPQTKKTALSYPLCKEGHKAILLYFCIFLFLHYFLQNFITPHQFFKE